MFFRWKVKVRCRQMYGSLVLHSGFLLCMVPSLVAMTAVKHEWCCPRRSIRRCFSGTWAYLLGGFRSQNLVSWGLMLPDIWLESVRLWVVLDSYYLGPSKLVPVRFGQWQYIKTPNWPDRSEAVVVLCWPCSRNQWLDVPYWGCEVWASIRFLAHRHSCHDRMHA